LRDRLGLKVFPSTPAAIISEAKTAGELYGRTLVVSAYQHYANQLARPNRQRRGSVLPRSHRDNARKAFERVTSVTPVGGNRADGVDDHDGA
jgi:hypothetical protein